MSFPYSVTLVFNERFADFSVNNTLIENVLMEKKNWDSNWQRPIKIKKLSKLLTLPKTQRIFS